MKAARRDGRAARLQVATIRGAAVTGLLLAASVLAGCSFFSRGGPTLVLYSGQHPQTTAALVSAFEHETHINVVVHSDDEDVLADQIVSEGDHSPADIIYTENSPALMYLQQRGLLAKVDASTLDAVPERFNSPSGDWVGVSARVSCLVYNTSRLRPSELPRSVLELASPRWKGLLAIAPGETDFQPIVTAVARAYGKAAALKWLDGIRANGAADNLPDNETITSMVNSGQAAIGIINHYYWYRLRAELGSGQMHSAIAFFAPRDPGYVVDVSGAGILASTHHMREAQAFLAFLVSRQGQEILAHSTSFEYPIGSGVTSAQPLPPFASLQPYPITIAELGDGAEALALMREAQLIP